MLCVTQGCRPNAAAPCQPWLPGMCAMKPRANTSEPGKAASGSPLYSHTSQNKRLQGGWWVGEKKRREPRPRRCHALSCRHGASRGGGEGMSVCVCELCCPCLTCVCAYGILLPNGDPFSGPSSGPGSGPRCLGTAFTYLQADTVSSVFHLACLRPHSVSCKLVTFL